MLRLIPTGIEELYAYVLDIDGKSIHSRVGSERFYAAVASLVGSACALRVAKHAEELEAKYPGQGWHKAAGILRGTWVEDGSETAAEAAVDDKSVFLAGGGASAEV
jgi:hypothetical protein